MKIKRMAISTSNFFDLILFAQPITQVKLIFPKAPDLPKNINAAFEQDMKKISIDFHKALKSINEQ